MALLLAILAVALAHALRRLRTPGWAVLGGAIVGMGLGPGILGRVAPEIHERLLNGGMAERRALSELVQRQEMDRAAALRLDLAPEGMDALQRRQTEARRPLEDAWRAAQWRDRRGPRIVAAACAVAVLLAGGAAAGARLRSRSERIAALHLGAWTALVPGAIAVGVLSRLGWPLPAACLAGAGVAIGPLALSASDRALAEATSPTGVALAEAAARTATALTLVAVLVATVLDAGRAADADVVRWPWMLPLAAAPLGAFLRLSPRVAAGTIGVALPALVALAFARVEPFLDAQWVPMLLLVLLAGDGRWLGAAIGGILPGGASARDAMRLAIVSGSAGPAQAVVASCALHAGLLDASLAYPLLVGAVLAECAAPMRRRAFAALG